MKKIFTGIFTLLILCFSSVSLLAQNKNQVIVYYFHTTFRCRSCHKIEQYTKESVEKYFSAEIKSEILNFKTINIQKQGNGHFVQDYKLYTKSVVLSLIQDGKETKFKNLGHVWQLLNNKEKFYKYIKHETQIFLNNLPYRKL